MKSGLRRILELQVQWKFAGAVFLLLIWMAQLIGTVSRSAPQSKALGLLQKTPFKIIEAGSCSPTEGVIVDSMDSTGDW